MFTRKDEDGRPLGDGTTIIYVNAKMQNYVTWLGLLMDDLCCVNPEEMFFPELRAMTRHFKENTEGVFMRPHSPFFLAQALMPESIGGLRCPAARRPA